MEWKGYKERWKVENGKKGEEKMEMEMGNNTTHIISSHHSLMLYAVCTSVARCYICVCNALSHSLRVSNLAWGH